VDASSVTTVTGEAVEGIEASELHLRRLSPDAVLLTYRPNAAGRAALLFHPGTATD
jgi:hypothetical protein